MKKFYETPAVEFTGFNVEDVITTSIVSTLGYTEGSAEAAVFEARVTANAATTKVGKAVYYGSYNW